MILPEKLIFNSPSKLEGVAQSAGGVCENTDTLHNSPSKLEGMAQSAGGVCQNTDTLHNSPSKLEGVPERRGRVSESSVCQNQRVKNTSAVKNFRRKLRSNSTPAEAALWNILKEKKIAGLQFRRQYSIGNFILDFYCPKIKLAIELDGSYHDFVDIKDLDRDKYLADNFGIQTIRFENKIVFQQPETIVNSILNVLEETHNSPSKLEGVAQSAGSVCQNTNTLHSQQADSSPNLGEEFSNSPSKLEGVARSARGVCENTDTLHSQQADSSPNLGEQLLNSPSKLEGVAQSAGGVCQNTNTRLNTAHSTAASGTSPNLREEFIDSPSKLEGVARSARGVCQNADTLHSQQADSSPIRGAALKIRRHK